jgi:hypothetical protein
MFENRIFRDAELLKAGDSLPVLSPGLRSRVLAAALEAHDRRAQGRRVLASAFGLFAMLAGVAWLSPLSSGPFTNTSFMASDASTVAGPSPYLPESRLDGQIGEQLADGSLSSEKPTGDKVTGNTVTGNRVTGQKAAGTAAASALSSFSPGQGLMSVMGDDWRSVEDQLRSRQEHFPRFQM